MRKKGFTTIELIVSFGLALTIMVFLFQIVLIMKNIYFNTGVKSTLLTRQALLADTIGSTLRQKEVESLNKCGSYCLDFFFIDGTSARLLVDKTRNIVSFDDYNVKLAEGSSFGEIAVLNESYVDMPTNHFNSYLQIKIEIKHKIVEGDFGVNIVYPYDSRKHSLPSFDFAAE